MNNSQSLHRPIHGRVLAGVCAGVARYLNIDVTLIRVVWALVTLFAGSGVLAYLIAWLLMPDADGRRTVTPLALLLVFFVLIPLLCFLLVLPVRVITGGF